MLRHRLLTGTLLAAGLAAELVADARLAPYFPILFALAMLCGVMTCLELVALLPPEHRPDRSAVVPGVLGVLASNWYVPASSGRAVALRRAWAVRSAKSSAPVGAPN